MGFGKILKSVAGLGSIGPAVLGPVMDIAGAKYEQDLNQKAAREAAEKSRDISVEMFNLQKQENLEAFQRNVARQDSVWEREKAYNAELWDKQNAYNTPAAQMERFKQAGINPLMVASQGTPGNAVAIRGSDVGQAAYDPAKPDSASMGASHTSVRVKPLGMLMDYMGIRNADMDLKNKAAQKALTDANKAYVDEQRRGAKIQNDLDERLGISRNANIFERGTARLVDWVNRARQAREDVKRGEDSYWQGRANMYRERTQIERGRNFSEDFILPWLINTQGRR